MYAVFELLLKVRGITAAGVPLEVIGRRLGHNDSKVTREIYFHVTESLKDKDAALLDAITLL